MQYDLKFFLKDSIRRMVDFSTTAQSQGMAAPPLEKAYPVGAALVSLPQPEAWTRIGNVAVKDAIAARKSHRAFGAAPLSLEELAFLLWATQGLRKPPTPAVAYRTVPSAGCRHALETYLAVFRVDGLQKGLYRYLPLEHTLVAISRPEDLEDRVRLAVFDQRFAAKAAVIFFWTTIPERMEWRYAEASYKVIALDAGHVCQNLYLACEVIGAGTCAIAAYDQDASDALLGVDGDQEFTLYIAPVGKV